MLKTFISFVLSVLVITGGLHVDSHDHVITDGYSICLEGCNEETHHNATHQCEQCLTKHSKYIDINSEHFSYSQTNLSFKELSKRNHISFTNFSLYSRPPPVLL